MTIIKSAFIDGLCILLICTITNKGRIVYCIVLESPCENPLPPHTIYTSVRDDEEVQFEINYDNTAVIGELYERESDGIKAWHEVVKAEIEAVEYLKEMRLKRFGRQKFELKK